VIGCDPNFSLASLGFRTIWSPTRSTDIGVEIMYTHLNQHMDPATVRLSNAGTLYVPQDENLWSVTARWQRNFLP
jgi:hypothetical protein